MAFFKKIKQKIDKSITDSIEGEIKQIDQGDLIEDPNQGDKKLTKQVQKFEKMQAQMMQAMQEEQTQAEKFEANTNKELDFYEKGLGKTKQNFISKLGRLFSDTAILDDDFFDELEEILISSDVSVSTTLDLVDHIKAKVKSDKIKDIELVKDILVEQLASVYQETIHDRELNYRDGRTNVYFFVGVNGNGKTTTVAKLAANYKEAGCKVLVAAADTFRAGAIEQLDAWAKKIGVDIVKSKHGASPDGLVYDAINKAKEGNYDILLVDTSGRLQNKDHLMRELEKMIKIAQKEYPEAPHETFLVLDSTTGQNGLAQAKIFKDIVNLTGVILTKMDSTAKGGIVFTIKKELRLSVKFIGFGEKTSDIALFNINKFIYAMFEELFNDE